MKKLLIIIIIAVLAASCGVQKETNSNTPQPPQTPETPVFQKDRSGNLSGVVTKEAFLETPFNTWFESGYESYTPNPQTIEQLSQALEDVNIRAYMGTWCGDSKRETPRLYNILEAADYDFDQLTLITVDRSKTQPATLVDGYEINRVPTFIFYRDGREIGRFVEYARTSLEEDMLKIVTGQDYKHSYEN